MNDISQSDTLGKAADTDLFQILRDGAPRTRSELASITGLARSTVAMRVDSLIKLGLVSPVGDAVSTGGRPSTQIALNSASRVVLGVDIGASHTLIAMSDLAGNILDRRSANLAVADGPEPVLDWGERWDLDIKGHVLVWGNGPPLSSSGVPPWLVERFPEPNLSEAEQQELRGLLEHHVRDSVSRFEGRIPVWDVTNETLQPLAQWFINRLGPGITREAFEWAREEDPAATLVMNEWIQEIFTGIGGATADEVRDLVHVLTR